MSSSEPPPYNELIEVAPGFFNVRGHFKMLAGIVDIGTQMSIVRLRNGNFLVIDTVPLTDYLKSEIDRLTDSGSKIEGVLGLHPFHTLAFRPFHNAYPKLKYYGCPRHLRKIPEICWSGSLNDADTRRKWAPEIEMRIPAGAEFISPLPESSNHFSSVFLFHQPSRTLHVDDTLMYSPNPGFFTKLVGFKAGAMVFQPSIKGPGLYPTADAPHQFRNWMRQILTDWNFDNIVHCFVVESFRLNSEL
ncbi:unnamed protein product [Didymodactylos carnosus]|uniref:Uncharacterized protein n=1 Tax=Didymodactylos carnosus TaxID=1234261 RepID=A0A8S2DHX1_9BILA|nr:unnamed protein product [Didymodactylos carnosus]CAF3736649.1 unnamed protein product [Didymodactylos carnosus]